MSRRLRLAVAAAALVAGSPSTAYAYGPRVVGIAVERPGTGLALEFTGDNEDNHLALERRSSTTLRVTVDPGEAIGVGDPAWKSYAGDRCVRVGDDFRTVDCDLTDVGVTDDDGIDDPPASITVDLKGGTSDRFEVKGTGLGLAVSAGSSAAEVTLIGGGELDRFSGGPGHNHLEGNGGDDLLWSTGDGDDVLLGGDGDDELQTQYGRNVLDGGSGDDLLRIRVNAYSDYVDPIEIDRATTCGPGNDVVWGLVGAEAQLPECERRVAPVATSEIAPAGVASVGRTLSVSSTTTGSPIDSSELTWRRCPALPTEQWACPVVGHGPTYTVTAGDRGYSLLLDGMVGWSAPRGRTVGFWAERRIAVEALPGPPGQPEVQHPVAKTPGSLTAPTPAGPSASVLAERLRGLFVDARGIARPDGARLRAKLPLTFGAPNGARAVFTIETRPAKQGAAPVVRGTGTVEVGKDRTAVIKLTRSTRARLRTSGRLVATLQVELSLPGNGGVGYASGRVVLKRR